LARFAFLTRPHNFLFGLCLERVEYSYEEDEAAWTLAHVFVHSEVRLIVGPSRDDLRHVLEIALLAFGGRVIFDPPPPPPPAPRRQARRGKLSKELEAAMEQASRDLEG
jgi:hypothetical protein